MSQLLLLVTLAGCAEAVFSVLSEMVAAPVDEAEAVLDTRGVAEAL
jgi:hypothetical protein